MPCPILWSRPRILEERRRQGSLRIGQSSRGGCSGRLGKSLGRAGSFFRWHSLFKQEQTLNYVREKVLSNLTGSTDSEAIASLGQLLLRSFFTPSIDFVTEPQTYPVTCPVASVLHQALSEGFQRLVTSSGVISRSNCFSVATRFSLKSNRQ